MARLETSLDARRTSTKGEVVSFIGGGKREIKKEKRKKGGSEEKWLDRGGWQARRVLFGGDEQDGGKRGG